MNTKLLCALAAACALAACWPCAFDTTSCVHECATTADCPSGLVCVHEHAHDLDTDTCEAPCELPDGGRRGFNCPDSPLGTACRTDDGQPFCAPEI
jgi:hypothetical protein